MAGRIADIAVKAKENVSPVQVEPVTTKPKTTDFMTYEKE
jgi:hypothetical protein